MNFEFLTLKWKLLYWFLFPSLNVWSWGWHIVQPKHTWPSSWVCTDPFIVEVGAFYLQKLVYSNSNIPIPVWRLQSEDAAIPPCPPLPGLCFSLTFNFHLRQTEKYLTYWFQSSRGSCSTHVHAQCVCVSHFVVCHTKLLKYTVNPAVLLISSPV